MAPLRILSLVAQSLEGSGDWGPPSCVQAHRRAANEALQRLAIPTTDVNIWDWNEAAAFTYPDCSAALEWPCWPYENPQVKWKNSIQLKVGFPINPKCKSFSPPLQTITTKSLCMRFCQQFMLLKTHGVIIDSPIKMQQSLRVSIQKNPQFFTHFGNPAPGNSSEALTPWPPTLWRSKISRTIYIKLHTCTAWEPNVSPWS